MNNWMDYAVPALVLVGGVLLLGVVFWLFWGRLSRAERRRRRNATFLYLRGAFSSTREWVRTRLKFIFSREKRYLHRMQQGKKIGWRLDPIETNLILRPVISLIAGQIIGWALYAFGWLMGSDVFPAWAATVFGLSLSLVFVQNEATKLTVPKAHVAILTFLGFRFNVYLDEGDHYWYGGRVGFGISTDALPHPFNESEKQGFVFVGPRQLEIYARKNQDDKTLVLENVARDLSDVMIKLTITIQTLWPLRWANSDDPVLDLAERARSAARTIVSFFTGADNALLKSVYSRLLAGHKMISAFTSKAVGIHGRGTVIQDRAGNPLFEIVSQALSEAELQLAKDKLELKIRTKGNPDMLTLVRTGQKGKGRILIEERGVTDHIIEVTNRIGAYFVHASVSDITLSDEVRKQANIASGESQQRIGQILSAQTIKEVRGIIAENGDQPGSELATMAALAKDGHAKIIYVPGSDTLTKAAVAGASQIGGNEK